MRNHVRLGALLPAIAGATIAASCQSGAAAEAADSEAPGTVSTYDIDVCTGGEYRPLEGVTRSDGDASANGAVDYMELRDEVADDSVKPLVIAKAGVPCASATDAEKCLADLAAFRSSAGWPSPYEGPGPRAMHRSLVWTAQDKVAAATTREGLRELLSVVENVKDAALLATEGATVRYRIVCDGAKNAVKTATGWTLRVESGTGCGEGAKVEEHALDVRSDGEMTVTSTRLVKEGDPNCSIGRRPDGLVSKELARAQHDGTSDPVGRFFAEAAHLEAASVVAFERLASELSALGAPRELVDSALASRNDEVKHARMTERAARRRGARPLAPVIAPAAERTMLAIALENAVEGCVRETYGALVAHHQAQAAGDGSIASMMRTIAEDETRHAGLAWDVAAWLEPQLSHEERAEVSRARARALAELREVIAREPSRELEVIAGMPTARRAVALLDALEERFVRPSLAAVA